MSTVVRKRFAAFALYAYRSLVLCICIDTVLRIAAQAGSRVNWLFFLLVLSAPLVAKRVYSLRRKQREYGRAAGR